MRVLVTGVSGFVGAHLVRELIDANHRVWGSDRVGSAIHGLEGGHALRASVTNRAELGPLLASVRPEAIIHLAAQSSPFASWQQPGETLAVNAAGTANLLIEAINANPDIIFLFISSSDVYGKGSAESELFTEKSPLRPHTPYAVSKVAAEQVATMVAQKAGARLIIARPFSHTGPGQTDRFVVPAFAHQIAEIECGISTQLLHGDLEPCRDFTDVRDVVHAYRRLIESEGAHGIFNISSGVAVSIQSILQSLCDMAECKVPCAPDPARIRGEGPNPVHGSADRLRQATGWSPRISLQETLADVLAEQRQALARDHRSGTESS